MLHFTPVDASDAVLDRLEKLGLILRLTPDIEEKHPEIPLKRDAVVYRGKPERGAHMVIHARASGINFPCFGYHADREDFLLIENERGKKPMFLLFSLLPAAALEQKIASNTVTESDFLCMRCRFNDPYLSFFTMLSGVPHAEGTIDLANLEAPGFFVSEPSDILFTRIELPEREILAKE